MLKLWLLALGVAACLGTALAAPGSASISASISIAALPREAVNTLRLIEQGGPFPYRRDGAIFANREGRLPSLPRGAYREYTVPTPGQSGRGARRIIAGKAGEYYYTGNHYRSFRRISE